MAPCLHHINQVHGVITDTHRMTSRMRRGLIRIHTHWHIILLKFSTKIIDLMLFQCLEGNFNNPCGQLQARSFPICSMYVLKITVLTNLFVISWQYFFAIWSCCICWGLRVGRAAGVIRGPVCSGMDSAEFKYKKSEFTISGNLFWIGQHLHVHVPTHV